MGEWVAFIRSKGHQREKEKKKKYVIYTTNIQYRHLLFFLWINLTDSKLFYLIFSYGCNSIIS
jgi:hypothetical protein